MPRKIWDSITTEIPTEVLDYYLQNIVPTVWITNIDEQVKGFYQYQIDPSYHDEKTFLAMCHEKWERHNSNQIEGHPV